MKSKKLTLLLILVLALGLSCSPSKRIETKELTNEPVVLKMGNPAPFDGILFSPEDAKAILKEATKGK